MENLRKNIVLIGMSGVGKTTIGRVLSKKINRKFLDMDQQFEELTKIRITDFFSTYGEKEFRRVEKKYYHRYFIKKFQACDFN